MIAQNASKNVKVKVDKKLCTLALSHIEMPSYSLSFGGRKGRAFSYNFKFTYDPKRVQFFAQPRLGVPEVVVGFGLLCSDKSFFQIINTLYLHYLNQRETTCL